MPRKKKNTSAKTKPVPKASVEVTQSSDPQAQKFLLFWIFIKATLLAVGFVLATFIIGAAIFASVYLNSVSRHSGLSLSGLYDLTARGWSTEVIQTEGRKNILILGVDTLSSRKTDDINTDTIMVASVNLNKGSVTTFSLPRDLFLTGEQMKINAVYARALKAGSASPETAVQKTVEALTGIPIHHVVVLEIQEVGKLIDALGGIEINVERSFKDEQYPRSDVNPDVVKNPGLLYQTVVFTAGKELMNGERALQFIRSRHSPDPIEGSDDARARRQQLVIEALIAKLSNRSTFKHPGYIGDLIRLYESDFQKYLPLEEMIGVGKIFLKLGHLPTFSGNHLAVKGFEDHPVIYHPERFFNHQWVYLLLDPTGKQLKLTIADWFK